MTRPRERSPEGGNKEEGFITWGMGGRRECLSREVTRSEVCSPRPALCHMLALSPDSPSLQVDVCLRRGQKPSHRSRETTSQAALSEGLTHSLPLPPAARGEPSGLRVPHRCSRGLRGQRGRRRKIGFCFWPWFCRSGI